MTLNSLRTFLRVRLYTAISLMVDIADTTETSSSSQFSINRSVLPHLTAIQPAEIPIHRLSGTNPIRYHSAIALQLASKIKVRPQELAMALCDAYDTLEMTMGLPGPFSIETNATGWLTLSLSSTDLMDFLDRTLTVGPKPHKESHESHVSSIPPQDLPFLIWQTDQRCQSLRSHLERHSIQALPKNGTPSDLQSGRLSDFQSDDLASSAFSALIESLLDWSDDEGHAKTSHKIYHRTSHRTLVNVCQCFDRFHRQVPLFHPQTSGRSQRQFLRSLAWVQGAIRSEMALKE